jgi:hypothetical protein
VRVIVAPRSMTSLKFESSFESDDSLTADTSTRSAVGLVPLLSLVSLNHAQGSGGVEQMDGESFFPGCPPGHEKGEYTSYLLLVTH